ncbi:MAG: hypothetical protein M1840_006604 [Geoglossum simile]|nr:MAG: hypothetical protein M1840_006604 [Geoglossum simile]
MLGRLRMSLDACEDAYLELSKKIFTPRRHAVNLVGQGVDFLQANGRFDAQVLEDAVKESITAAGIPQDALLQDQDSRCKVFACAAHGEDSELAILRSYETSLPEELFDECKIWEAARATSAATTFFDSVQIGRYGQKFVDGAIVYNNPIHVVHHEAQHLWPDKQYLILSIGTGSVPGGAFEGNIWNIVKRMKDILAETEKTNERFFLDHTNMMNEKRLFRFNVYHGLGQVGLEEWKEKAAMATATQTYLRKGETMAKMKDCQDGLKKSIHASCNLGPVGVEGKITGGPPISQVPEQ